MKEKNKSTLVLTSILTLLPMLAGIVFWRRLPREIATHFDSYGVPNGWSSKWFAVFGLPVFIFAVNLVCILACERDPKRAAYPKQMMKILYWICPVVSWICAVSIYGYALGLNIDGMTGYIPLILGFLFIILGNYLPKVKRNYYLGIKLPWTRADEDNWNKTHRLGGKVWVLGGLLIIANYFLKVRGLELVLIFAMVLIPSVYSWAYSIRKKEEHGHD